MSFLPSKSDWTAFPLQDNLYKVEDLIEMSLDNRRLPAGVSVMPLSFPAFSRTKAMCSLSSRNYYVVWICCSDGDSITTICS